MKPSYRFASFVLDGRAYRLVKADAPLDLPPKVLDLLFLLVSRPAALVTKEDILDALWPGVAVTDNAITQVVSDLRQALGDTPASSTFVQTVPRRGYRFIADVTVVPLDAAAPGDGGDPQKAANASAARAAADAAAASSGTADRAPRTIAVMDFANVSGDTSMNWLAAGIAETMTHDLRAVRELLVVDRVTAADAERFGPGGAATPDLLVVGSVQRSGERLRITARVVDAVTRAAVAHARADGGMADIFEMQDALVTQLSANLQPAISPEGARIRARETSSLDAYRALTEGRLKLETLDPAEVPGAIADFTRALAWDPRYALAHVGLAHACFWRFQASRAAARPETDQLASAIAHAKRAVALDADLAEAHSALALFLSAADRFADAVAEGRLAVAIEPANWRHQFRYGIAAWGDERLTALHRVTSMFPPMAFAYFGIATVHIARGNLADADRVLRQGTSFDDTELSGTMRLPGNGLHWLLGLIRLTAGDTTAARAEFDRELARSSRGLLGQEYAMDACVGHAYALLRQDDLDGAARMFEQAITRFPDDARSWLGLATVRHGQGRRADTEAAASRGLDAIDLLRTNGRPAEAAYARCAAELLAGRSGAAIAALEAFVAEASPGPAGWSIPVEAAFAPLAAHPAFRSVLDRLAARAE